MLGKVLSSLLLCNACVEFQLHYFPETHLRFPSEEPLPEWTLCRCRSAAGRCSSCSPPGWLPRTDSPQRTGAPGGASPDLLLVPSFLQKWKQKSFSKDLGLLVLLILWDRRRTSRSNYTKLRLTGHSRRTRSGWPGMSQQAGENNERVRYRSCYSATSSSSFFLGADGCKLQRWETKQKRATEKCRCRSRRDPHSVERHVMRSSRFQRAI